MALSPNAIRAFAVVANGESELGTQFDPSTPAGKMLQAAAAKEREEAEKVMGKELVTVVRGEISTRRGLEAQIAALSEEIGQVEAAIAAIDTTKAYGEGSGNFFPYLTALGQVSESGYVHSGLPRSQFAGLCVLPEGDGGTDEG